MPQTEQIESTIAPDVTRIGCSHTGSGPALLVVHGTGADRSRWKPILPALEESFSIYCVDRRGRGASGDGPEYALEREAEDIAAVVDLGSAYVALHRFTKALAVTKYAERLVPGDAAMLVREASVDLELGRYDDARSIIERLTGPGHGALRATDTIALETLRARSDELTGHLARARERFATVTAHVDARYDQPAQQRAWFWFRSGELAFEVGERACIDDHESLDAFLAVEMHVGGIDFEPELALEVPDRFVEGDRVEFVDRAVACGGCRH